MPRTTKKKNEQPAAVTTTIEPVEPGKFKRQTVEISTWADERPLSEAEEERRRPAEPVNDVDEEPDENDEPEAEAEPLDPIEEALGEIKMSPANWTIVVEQIPRYSIDGKFDPRSRRYCGALAVNDPEYIPTQGYIADIQRLYARAGQGNDFYCTLRRNGKVRCHLGIFSINPPVIDTQDRSAAQIPMPAAAAPAHIDPFQQVEASLKFVTKLTSSLAPLLQLQQAQVQPAPQMTEEAAILKLLSADDALVSKTVDRLAKKLGLGESAAVSGDAPWYQSLLIELARNPAAVLEMVAVVKSMFSGPIAPPQLPPPAVIQQQTPEPAVQAIPPEMIFYGHLVRSCQQRLPVEAVSQSLLRMIQEYPELAPMLDTYVEMAPALIIEQIAGRDPQAAAIVKEVGALEWMQALINEMRAEEAV